MTREPQPVTHSDYESFENIVGLLRKAIFTISNLFNTSLAPPNVQKPLPTFLDRTGLPIAQAYYYLLDVINRAHWTTLLGFLIIFLTSVHRMSRWSNGWGGWSGRFSPFGRGSESPIVSDSDFSYITADDLARQSNHHTGAASNDSQHTHRKNDVLVLKHRRESYPVHFKGGSIDRGELTVGDIRDKAAESLDIGPEDAGRIKLFFRGRNLKDDSKLAREEGLHSDQEADLLCVVGEAPPVPPAEDEDDEDEEEVDDGPDEDPTSPKKKRRNRKKKSKKGKGGGANSGTATPTASDSRSATPLNPDATYIGSHGAPPPPKPAASPAPPAPKTAADQLDAIASKFHTTLVPQCITFAANPPADKAKRDFEHKKLTETIMAQVLLKLDAIETMDDAAARQRRKDLVKEVQGMLMKLDEVVK